MTTTKSMNAIAGFGKMLKKTYAIGILTASTLGVLPLAAQANPQPCCQPRGGDNAIVQTSQQNASVTGKGNSLSQNANQSANNGSSARVRPAATKRPARTQARRPAHRPAPRPAHRPAPAPCK